MNIKKLKSVTPSSRNTILLNTQVNKRPLLKSEIIGLTKTAGRNNSGKIASRRKGGGHKRKFRKINFVRSSSYTGIIFSLEYDPNRSANIASVFDYKNKNYFYILAPKNLKIGDIVKSGVDAEVKNGHTLPLSKIPVGSLIHNISPKSNTKAQISRSAGTFSQLVEKTAKTAKIRVSSGEYRKLSIDCLATIGRVSNEDILLTTLGKAGRSRWLNKRPKVRGVAMNPVDHPHGGGEGKTSGGRSSVSPWGKPAKNGKTSRSKNKLRIFKNE